MYPPQVSSNASYTIMVQYQNPTIDIGTLHRPRSDFTGHSCACAHVRSSMQSYHMYNPVQQPNSRYSTVLSPQGCLMSPSYNRTLPLPQTINLFSKSIAMLFHKFYINFT